MRLGLDVRYLSHGLVGGIHTYLRNFVPALIEFAPCDTRVFLYADTKRPFDLTDLPPNVTLRLLPYHNPLSSLNHDFSMGRAMARDNLDLAHFTASYGFSPPGLPAVVTLQDEINLIPLTQIWRGHRKDLRTIAMMTYLHFVTRAALKRAQAVITVSEYSRRQIVRHSGLDPDRVVTIPHACPRDIVRVDDPEELAETRRRLGLRPSFILAEAFKNPDVVVRAWKLLPEHLRADREIVFFSRSPEVRPAVRAAVDGGFARLLVRPARRDLCVLYSLAEVFVFPSWIEGFGIPLIEAMTCGAPVIASDRGSCPEVAAEAAIIIDAEDEQTLAAHLGRLFQNPAERAQWQASGYRRAAQFTWPVIIRQVFECYARVAARAVNAGAARS
jgi:glycosyltransferase involved in cell wall biosynthesis